MSHKLPKKGLYAITPDIADTDELLSKVELALKGGIALLQYRDKTSSTDKKLQRANALHTLCINDDVPLIINDEPELALACNAEGVHLGQGDGSIQTARKLLGEKAIIGVTCHHDVSLAINAQAQGADYVAFGRFYPSSTKPGKPLATIDTLANAKKSISIPIVSIGGITFDNAQPIINAGTDYISIVENIFMQEHITPHCQKLSRLF